MLDAEGLCFRIGDATIVRGVTLSVSPGEVVALCGPNGAGKSTLLSLLSGEQSATSGEVRFQGKSLSKWSPVALARLRAKLSQESTLTFAFRVYEVVEMGRFPYDTPKLDGEIIRACLQHLEIEHLEDRFYTSLSGGEKQRVQLARALAQLTSEHEEPRMLLLDEPTSALDLLHQEVALKRAHDLCREHNYGVVVVLHDLNLASAWADRILLMKEGRLVRGGVPRDVLTPEVLRDTYGIGVLVLPHPQTGRPIVTIDRQSV